MIWIIIGAVLLIVAVVLFFVRRGAIEKTRLIRDTPSFDAASIPDLPTEMQVEVKGTLRCDGPLTAEFSGRPCVYVSSSVTREYEDDERDSKGNTRTVRRSENVANNRQSIVFAVEDATGRVLIDPERADIDAVEVVNRFEPAAAGGLNISVGGVSFNLSGGNRTLGYRYREQILPLDAPIYVLGVTREGGTIGSPPRGSQGQRFIISHRTEEALESSYSSQSGWLGYGAIGSAVAGVILIAIGVVTRGR